MSLVAELRRRNVFRVAAAYLVVGWLLTEVLTTVFETVGAPGWAVRAVVLIFALGFVPVVVFSWFYELTPEGIKRDDDVGLDDEARSRGRKNLDYVTVGGVIVLIVFIGLFSAQQTGDDTQPGVVTPDAASVAVLPFENLSDDEDNEYFSDGLTETLLHMLAQVPELKVAARTSSFAFRGEDWNIREIAAALGVAHVLEGSVQRAGDRVRITAQLIRASDGFHVWSSKYDRTLDDIFVIQDEIASKVGFALSESLLGPAGQGLAGVQTSNPDAYDLYLQARKERSTYSYGGLRAAEDLLKGALLIDPDFVEARTELASSYIQKVETGLMSPAVAFPEIKAIVGQVLEVRPDDVVGRAIFVFVETLNAAMAGEAAELPVLVDELETLVEQAPDVLQPRILLVRAYMHSQQNQRAVPVLEQALEQDPFNPQIHYELGALFMRLERFDDARAALERSLAIEPQQPNAYINLAKISANAGDGVGFVRYVLEALEVDPRDHELPGMLAEFLYHLDLIDEGDDFRARVLTIAPTSPIAYRTELSRAISAGDEEAAQASARRAIRDRIEPRYFAFAGAVQYLLRHAIRNNAVDAEFAWIAEHVPGIFDVEGEGVPAKYREAQSVAFDAWYVTLPRDELIDRLDRLLGVGRALGFDPVAEPYTKMQVHALRGEVQEAVQVALDEIFSQSVIDNLGWRRTFEQAQYAGVVADPRVQAAMQRWEEDEAAIRSSVEAYLADLQAAA